MLRLGWRILPGLSSSPAFEKNNVDLLGESGLLGRLLILIVVVVIGADLLEVQLLLAEVGAVAGGVLQKLGQWGALCAG